jgi:hypothetical protein
MLSDPIVKRTGLTWTLWGTVESGQLPFLFARDQDFIDLTRGLKGVNRGFDMIAEPHAPS